MAEEGSAGEAREIQAIDKGSVHRICSGQVVLNLATAIKELVENSIDAGATSVEVRLREHGSELLEVIDNGSGVEENNFSGLTLKHHTSKLKDFSDLVNVDTFGFRGEALSSLCALSKLTITTCHKDVNVGAKIEYDHNGKIVKQSPCPRQRGTTVSLENLFSTLPVRHREFLRNIKREFTKAIQVLNAYCIISTGVRITCTNQIGKGKKNIVVSTGGNQTVKENITNVFGAKQGQSLLLFHQGRPADEVCSEYGITEPQKGKNLFEITGYLSSSEHGQGRSSSDRQFYFINKRPCDPQKISRLVNEVYHMYNRHQNPFVMMDISLAKESVDVNVTPDKRQIFIQEEKLLMATIKSSLMTLFEPKSSVYRINEIASKNSPLMKSFSRTSPLKSQNSCPELSTKRSLTSSLVNFKRSFSSAFARDLDHRTTDNADDMDENKVKQRKLDGFLVTKSSDFEMEKSLNVTPSVKLTAGSSQESSCEDTQTDSRTDSQTSGISSADTDTLNNTEPLPVTRAAAAKTPDKTSSDHWGRCSSDENRSSDSKCAPQCEDLPPEKQLLKVADVTITPVVSVRVHSDVKVKDDGSPDKDIDDVSHKYTQNSDCDTSSAPCETVHSEADCRLDNEEHAEDLKITFTQFDECSTSRHVKEQKVPFSMKKIKEKLGIKLKCQQTTDRQCRNFRAQINPADNATAEEELQKEISKDMFKQMKILGQFNLGFIITKLGRDLFIVDQHATDEKFNFETLQRETVIQGQKLIQPQNLELTAANECILMDNLEIFHKNGFDFHVDEDGLPTQRVQLTTMPVSKNWTFGKDDIEELVFMLTDSPGVMCRPSRIRQMFASRACRKSIMIGTALNNAEMRKNCPHGRPTMRHLINLDMLPD